MNFTDIDEQLFSSICAIAGQCLSAEASPTKDNKILLHANGRTFLKAQLFRLRAILNPQLVKRETFFAPAFNVGEETMNDQAVERLLPRFTENPSEKQLDDCWKEFKEVQAVCRNSFGPPYSKWLKGNKQSGVYDDKETLTSMLQKIQCDAIENNKITSLDKKVAAFVKKYKEENNNENPILADKLSKRAEFEGTMKVAYEKKKLEWTIRKLPQGWLAFVILGLPGNQLPYLGVTVPSRAEAHGRPGRLGLSDTGSGGGTSNSTSGAIMSAISLDLVTAKKAEASVKAFAAMNAQAITKLNHAEKLIQLLEENPTEAAPGELEKLKRVRLNLLRESVDTSPSKMRRILSDLSSADTSQRAFSFSTPSGTSSSSSDSAPSSRAAGGGDV